MERSYVICLLTGTEGFKNRASEAEDADISSKILSEKERKDIGRELDLNGAAVRTGLSGRADGAASAGKSGDHIGSEKEKTADSASEEPASLNEASSGSPAGTSPLRKDYIADWSAEHFAVVFDPKGICRPKENTIEGLFGMPEPAHVVVILSEASGGEQLSYLHDRKISYAFAPEDQVPEEIDPEKALKKLYRLFSVDRLLMIPGGPEDGFFRRFVNRGLVDEICILQGNSGRMENSSRQRNAGGQENSALTHRLPEAEQPADDISERQAPEGISAPEMAVLFADADGQAPELQDLGNRTLSGGGRWQRFKVKHRENLSKRKLYQTEIGPVCMTEREFEEYMELRELRELKKGKSSDIIDLHSL